MIVFLCDEPQGCFHQNNMAAELTTSLFSLRLHEMAQCGARTLKPPAPRWMDAAVLSTPDQINDHF